MALTPRLVFRYFNTDGVPASGDHEPIKSEIIALLEQMTEGAGAGVVAGTLAQLNGITPEEETDGGLVLNDPNPANNGYYYRDSGVWVKGRGFPDTFAQITLGGTANAQTGVVGLGINPADILVFFATVGTDNTGAMTLSVSGEAPRDVVNAAGNPLSAGEWTGTVLFFINGDGDYQLLFDAGAVASTAANATAAAASEAAAEDAADRAEVAAAGVEFPVSYAVQDLSAAQRAQARSNLDVAATFPTVAEMVSSTKTIIGQAVQTLGYYAAGDGGGNMYKIVAAATGTDDGGAFIDLSGITGQAQALFPDGRPNVLQWGVKADNVADDTAAMQAAIDWNATNSATLFGTGNSRLSTARRARITQVTFWGSGACFDFDGMLLFGAATTPTNSCVQFKQGLGFTRSMTVATDFNSNYECAIQRYTNDLNTFYPGREKFRDITISGFAIGLVVGGRPSQGLVTFDQGTVQADGIATDAPVSEEFWDGLDVQDCPTALYFNQPNGKVIFYGTNFECKPDGYEAVNGAVGLKTALQVPQGEVNIIGGAVESNQDTDALLMVVGDLGHVNIVGATMEANGAPTYLAGLARLRISNIQNFGFNGIEAMFYVDQAWYGELVISDAFLLRGAGFSSAVPVVKSVSNTVGSFAPCLDGFVTFSNVEFGDVNFATDGTYNPICMGVRARFNDCLLAQGSLVGDDYVRSHATRLHSGQNLLAGKVDLAATTVTAYGTNGNATSGGWTVTVSGAGTKDWGSTTTGLPTLFGETPAAAFRIETGVGGLVGIQSPDSPAEPSRFYTLTGLIKTNGAAANLLVRAIYKNFTGSVVDNIDAFNGNANLLANTEWQPFMLRLKKTNSPNDAATMRLLIQAQEGAGVQFADLRIT